MKKLYLIVATLLFGTFAALGQVSEVCEDVSYTSGKSTAYFSMETADNGDVLLEISCKAPETGIMYRANPTNLDFFYVNEEKASNYFDATKFSDDKTVVILPKKSGVTIPSGAIVYFKAGTLEWQSDQEGNGWVMDANFQFTYGTICCTPGKQLKASLTDVQFTTASIQIKDPCLDGSGYVHRLRYAVEGSSEFTTISGRPAGGTYELTELMGGTYYTAIAEAAYPDFDNPTGVVEQSVVDFATRTSCSSFCDVKYTKDKSTIGISVEEYTNKNLVILMASPSESTTFFNNNTSFTTLSNYKVNNEAASNYYEEPVLSADKKRLTFVCKKPIPANSVFHFSGILVWTTPESTNNFIEGATLDYTYGRLGISNIAAGKNTAVVTINNSAIEYDGYQYRLKYRRAGESDYSISTDMVDKSFTLSNLLSGTEYVIIAEAAYPSFEQQDILETSSKSFTTTSSCSSFCNVQYTCVGQFTINTIGISIEEYTNGNVNIVLASPSDPATFFTVNTDITSLNKYKVNNEDASNYFSSIVVSENKKVLTLVNSNAVPANSTLHFNGTMIWTTAETTNNFINGAKIDYTFGRLAIAGIEAEKNLAVVTINNDAIETDGFQYRLKYRRAGESDYSISTDMVGKTFTLSNLIGATVYEVVLEAAYPSFDDPDLFESCTSSFATSAQCTSFCDVEYTCQGQFTINTIGISVEEFTNGNVNIVLANPSDPATFFTVNTDITSLNKYKVNNEDASNYYSSIVVSEDKKVLTLVNSNSVPANSTLHFNGTMIWTTEETGNNYINGAKIDYTFGRMTISNIVAGSNSATVTIDDTAFATDGYQYRLKYRIEGESEYSIETEMTGKSFMLSDLSSGTDYEIIAEAAYPSFEQQDVLESVSDGFSTTTKGSAICDYKFTNTNTIGVSMESQINGDVICSLVSYTATETPVRFKKEDGHIVTDISFYKVVSSIGDEEASEYFDAPVLSADQLSFTLKLKKSLPANATLALAKTGKIVWEEGPTARWCDSDAAFVGFEHTYGTICCVADNAIRFGTTEVTKNSAQLKLMDDCIFGEGYTYSMEYGIKGSGSTAEIAGRPEGGLYNLSDLYYETTYTATVTATNSALGRVETKSIEFTTKSASSEACSVEFTGVNAEHTICYISMETSPSGDIVVSISGENNTKFRTEGLTYDIGCYKVNGADASTYFDAPVLSSDKLTATLKSKGNVPDGATISFAGTISWTSDLGDDYITGQSMTHTYGTWCCEVSGFKMTRCEGLSNTTAIVEIDNLCIEDKPYVYRYSLKEGEGEYGAPVSFTGLTINLDGLSSATTYNIKIEAALPDFDDPEDVREQIGTFSTSALSPAPVPTYSENLVKTVYSSTYGEAANLNWNYYTFVKTLSNEVISSESVLKKCVMYATPTAGKEPQNGVLIKYPSFWDVSAMVNLHFDLWISAADAVKSPYVGVKLRHEDGANTSWYICNDQLTGNAWNSFDIPVSWFAENESLDLSEVLSMMIIPIANKTGSTADAQFSDEEYTIYLDNIFYYVPGAAKIGDNYYNTLAEAVTAAQDDDEITLVADIDEDLNVAGKSISLNADGHSIASVTVAANASLTLASALALTGDFILKSDITTSGQFSTDGNAITIGGNAYFDKKFSNSNAIAWYTFSLPFSVSVNDIYDAATGTHLEYYNETYAQYFNGASRANGGAVWTGIDEGSLSAGTLYTFTVRQAAKYKDIRFKAADKSAIISSESIPLTYYTGKGDQSLWGWNGVGNNQLFGASMSVEGLNFGQAYNASTKGYDLIMLNDHTFNAGDAIFFQCAQNGNVIVAKASTKSAEASYNPYILEISAAGVDATDKCFVTVSDDASPAYQIGKDLVKMGDYKNYGHATLWVEAYGKQLAVVDAQSQSGATDIALGINAPKAGSYTLSLSAGDADNDIYLTLGGEAIWDLADGAYALNLKQGVTSGYGLRIEGDVPTSVAEAEAGSNKAIKYIENGAVVIEVNGVRYNLQGIMIK